VALRRQLITAGDANRSYLVAEPPPGEPISAVILSLHGTRSTAARQAQLSGFEQLAQTASAVVVFPQAIEPIGAGYEWDLSQDVDYIAVLVTELLKRHQPHPGRVLLTGMSGGARMSSLFASVHPELVQVVGAVAGLRSPVDPVHRAVPIVAFHGTKDKINPYGGSGTQRWNESVPDAARAWALANGITAPPTEVAVSPTLTRTTYGGEGQPGEVML
jgi:polyhydroxybutyrate depolymerase